MIYDAFIKLCAQVNKTPSAVAIELGLEKSTVSRWKRGGGANDSTKQKIADYFGVTVSDLLGETTPNVPYSDTRQEMPIDALWNKLNPAGQAALLDYADTLVSSGKYAIPMTQAAARGGGRMDVPEDTAKALLKNMKEDDADI